MIFPSVIDPDMAPPGQHVVSCFVQYAPYDIEGGWDDAKKEAFAEAVISTIEQYAPNIRRAIVGMQVITPVDIEAIAGHHRRQHLPRRTVIAPDVLPAPGAALGGFPHARARILFRRGRRASRRRGDGRARHAGGEGNLEGPARMNQYDVLIIGAGHNGLTAAAYLAKAGRRVLVLERREIPGGTLVSEDFDGFTADMVQSGCLRPAIVRDLKLPLPAPIERPVFTSLLAGWGEAGTGCGPGQGSQLHPAFL